jgi:N-acetyl-anhydromuramyl-L-alanine amidase AmpD/LysM repeat protein
LRDFTTAALYGAPANAMKLSTIPQAAMTEGIEALRGKPYDFSNVNPNFGGFTSNQRDLSQTMGYENPEGFLQNAANFGLSMIDPTIFMGGKTALRQPVKQGLKKVDIEKFVPEKIVFDLMDESIDPFGQVLKNIKIDNTPSPFAKDVRREAFKYQQLASDPRYLERVKNIDRDFGSRLEPLLNQFKNDEIENVGQYFPFNISVADRIPYSYGGDEVDVLGISGLNANGMLKKKMSDGLKYPEKIKPSTDRYIEINEPRHIKENIPARGTVHHELKHHWTNALNDPENKNYSQALKNLISRRSELGIDPRDVTANQNYNYLSSPTEVDAYLMTNLRDDMVNRGYLKDHFDELTEDKLNDFILKEKDIRDVKEYFSPGREMIFDRSKFVDFFNKYGLPSTVIGGVLGGQAIDQQKNGGITKDNQGYWNPDNWGKPVEIDSNNITMEGVYEPLLGVSDTGDTKLMKPGKNYKFKGKKVTEFPLVAKDGGKFMNQYTINQGDTLSKISKETGYSVEQLAKLNNIEDPNKIYAGQKLTIPYKFDKSLSIKEIPQEHHKNIVIDDYSKSFNYLVQGDKVYYAKKNSDNWVDISDNNKAKGNLYTHIDDKYGMKGYSDYEKSIRKSIADSTYNYDNSYNQRYSTAPTNYVKAPKKSPESLELKGVSINSFNNSFKQPKALPVVNDPFGRLSRMVPNYQAKEESNPIVDYLSDMYDKASDFATDVKEGVSEYVDLGANWLDRQYNKQSDAREESSYIKEPIITNSEYSINQPIITGDTLRIDDDRYYLPEVMDLNEFTFKNRNRNELTPIETDAASITAFNPFQEYDAVKKSNYPKDANFIGVDSKGNFKSGSLDQFGPKDKLSRVFKNNVESFVTDKNNEMKFVKWNDNTIINGKRVGNKDNPNSYVPLVNVIGDDGNKTVGTLNLLVKSPKELGTFGQITGGRLIFKQGDKQILVSGSVKDIKSQFDKLSKNGPVEVLTLDNGSYSRGLRTYDKQLSPQQLQEYDRQNVSGGHFLYSTGQKTSNKYPEERFQTPNIRTKKDESYKQGHPLKNELQGVVLHQTAYSEKDLSKVHKQFMTPNKNSAHVLIGYDGERRIYADPEQVTFHGGVSSFKGRENVNDFMLGLEFQGVAGKDKLTDEQIESAVEYLTPIIRKYNIPIEHITSHAAVAPGRKHDVSNDDLEKIYKIIRDRLYNKKRNGGVVGINQLDAQPMKKLNQLLNFTNNPDKDNWLDKYN